jgi:hypothetical protein
VVRPTHIVTSNDTSSPRSTRTGIILINFTKEK